MNIEHPPDIEIYLRGSGYLAKNETFEMSLLKGGVSNKTVLLQRENGSDWVLKQALPKLRVEVDWFSPPERIALEARGMQWLSRLTPPGTIPGFIFFDADHYLLCMEAIPQPHANFKQLLLHDQPSADYFTQFGALLGQIHANAQHYASELQSVFVNRSFFKNLRLEPFYLYTAECVPAAKPFLHQLVEDCLANQYKLVHGDYSPKNILIYKGQLILLDHEVIHWGDGTFDLGFSLTHLLSKAHHMPEKSDYFETGIQQYWQAYQKTNANWDPNQEERAVRHTLGCLLARVHGRSPLEYLTQQQQKHQTEAVLALMKKLPMTIPELTAIFLHHVYNR